MNIHFSSKNIEWETPQDLFDKLNEIHQFKLDVCASTENAKCNLWHGKELDGLATKWTDSNWMNPPYGREIGKWIKKASENPKTVCLLPARTDTKWFHNYIYNKPNVTIEFLKGRLKFGNCENNAPFPSMIVIFN